MLERMIDLAADELGLDPAELRRRNFLEPDAFPFHTLTGRTYDSGDYDLPLREALRHRRLRRAAGRAGGPRREAATRGQLGIGDRRLRRDHRRRRRQRVRLGRGARRRHGDGLGPARPRTGRATRRRSRCSSRTGSASRWSTIRFVQSDTALVPAGRGHRRLAVAADGRQRRLAARPTTCSSRPARGRRRCWRPPVDDVELPTTAGSASPACRPARVAGPRSPAAPTEDDEPLPAELDFNRPARRSRSARTCRSSRSTPRPAGSRRCATSPSTTAAASLNPLLVAGQQHGGLAQGIAQALWEEVVYDADGHPLTATLADYRMPTAADLPRVRASPTPRRRRR